jgi:hypothetical protein
MMLLLSTLHLYSEADAEVKEEGVEGYVASRHFISLDITEGAKRGAGLEYSYGIYNLDNDLFSHTMILLHTGFGWVDQTYLKEPKSWRFPFGIKTLIGGTINLELEAGMVYGGAFRNDTPSNVTIKRPKSEVLDYYWGIGTTIVFDHYAFFKIGGGKIHWEDFHYYNVAIGLHF